MVKIYDSLRDSVGNLINGRTKLFVKCTDDDGIIDEYMSGLACVPESSGRMFIVDDWLPSQIDKLLMIDNELVVKDGETIDEPTKTQKQLMIEELERQMAELESTPDEVLEENVEPEEEEEVEAPVEEQPSE